MNNNGIFDSEIDLEVLQKRAKELSRLHQEECDDEYIELVEFTLGAEHYGLELVHVREVYPLHVLTFLPGVPKFVKGITNFRGQIISILDLKVFFELEDLNLSDQTRLIILKSKDMEFAVIADTVIGVCRVPSTQISAGLPALSGKRAEYLKGVGPEGVIVLDALRLLEDPTLVVDI